MATETQRHRMVSYPDVRHGGKRQRHHAIGSGETVMERFDRQRETRAVVYLDPQNGFREKHVSLEIRRDGITGVTSHILAHRFRAVEEPAVSGLLQQSPGASCPFCPERFEAVTPRFTADIIPEGKFRRGTAVLFPNAFPYESNNAVAVFSPEHIWTLEKVEPRVIRDGLLVCRDYFQRLVEIDPALRFCSINWNYLPPAGGGLVHPHVQTVAGSEPTAFVRTNYESAARYRRRTGKDLWRDLVDSERGQGERFIASGEGVDWIAGFSPKGMAGDICFYLPDRHSIFELSDADVEACANGLSKVFRYLAQGGLRSFNLALYATVRPDDVFCVQGRIVPRFLLPPLGTSDVNYFEKLHSEIICIVIPEEMARELRPHFDPGPPRLDNTLVLSDGTQIGFRPIRPSDLEGLEDLAHALSEETMYNRHMARIHTLPESVIREFVFLDDRTEECIVATHWGNRGEEIIATGRYFLDPGTNRAEATFVVRDDWQSRGIGTFMFRLLAATARARGIAGFTAAALKDNKRMQSVFNHSEYRVRSRPEDDLQRFEIDFQASDSRQQGDP
jgi:UDPglucose--hexose-1-phosphate uridylyltransferase